MQLLIAPLMRIDPVGPPPAVAEGQGAVFTSVQGVYHAPQGAGRPAWCVGQATTRVAVAAGWRAVQAGETAEQLIATLLASPPDRPLQHICGEHQRGDIAENLATAGLNIRRTVAYRQTLLRLGDAARAALGGPAIVPLFSPRTALQFAQQAPENLANVHIVALSDAVAENLGNLRAAELLVTQAPTGASMLKTVEMLCTSLTSA
ncbi:uroporphyrinogen-III synthase [Sulfitobacter sp. HNIBRBA3233]|uniref:uroporphyrinogen-III synthase n=1 Tax=Sulfitobacter marinivivus TaxID=3158558 RepID=UPI0032DF62B6